MSCVMNCYQSPPFLCCRVINRNSFSSAWGINFAYTQQVFEQLLSVRHCVKCWDTKRRSHSVSTCRVLEMDEQMGTIMWKCISQSCTVLGRKIGQWQNAQRKITSARGDREKGFESLLSQNGMCKCEACSIWAGPQMEKSWVCGDREMVRRGWESIPGWGTRSKKRAGQKEHRVHLSSSCSVDGWWGVAWCMVERVLCAGLVHS